MTITDEEIDSLWFADYPIGKSHQSFARALLALQLERLAACEMPEAVGFMWQHDETGRIGFAETTQEPMWKGGNARLNVVGHIYTADQLHAAHAAGVAKGMAVNADLLKKARWVISVSATDCEHLSHANKREQHTWAAPCPVEAKVNAIIDELDAARAKEQP